MAVTAYQIELELDESKPKIWRRLIIPADMLLSDLHKVIQVAMGWTNSHLHQFEKGNVILEPPVEEDVWESIGIDYTGYTIDRLLEEENDTVQYHYDFGDGWVHTITLEKVMEGYDGELPVCKAGAMNCPPEDIGGIWGFQEFEKAMNNPSHPEHVKYREWYGETYDPEYFDCDHINESLREDNFGLFEW